MFRYLPKDAKVYVRDIEEKNKIFNDIINLPSSWTTDNIIVKS